jgi:hypothetical protein
MQFLPVYLYQNDISVILDLDQTIIGVNRVMYQRDLTIHRGIKNQIRVQFKNSDQKRVTVSNTQTFLFSMYEIASNRLLMEKTLTILDDGITTSTRGLALLTINENDTIDLDRSDYTYNIKYYDDTGSLVPTYSNTYYGVSGTIKLDNTATPSMQPSQVVTNFQESFNSNAQLYEFKSGNIYAYPEYNGNSALHTAALYMTNFKGTVYVQATLYNNPDSYNRYFTVNTTHYDGFTGIDYINFNGVFTYVRFMFVPDTAPAESTNNNPAFYGSFDKLLYKC